MAPEVQVLLYSNHGFIITDGQGGLLEPARPYSCRVWLDEMPVFVFGIHYLKPLHLSHPCVIFSLFTFHFAHDVRSSVVMAVDVRG